MATEVSVHGVTKTNEGAFSSQGIFDRTGGQKKSENHTQNTGKVWKMIKFINKKMRMFFGEMSKNIFRLAPFGILVLIFPNLRVIAINNGFPCLISK